MQADNLVQMAGHRPLHRTPSSGQELACVPAVLRVVPGAVELTIETDELLADFRFSPVQAEEFALEMLRKAMAARLEAQLAAGAVKIDLGRDGMFALVDAADADRVRAFNWRLKVKRDAPRLLYAQRSYQSAPGVKVNEMLHTFILGALPGQLVDHRDGDGLNNQRENLRLCTRRENSTNVTSSKQQKLGGYKGVSWNPRAKKWQASICSGEARANGKRKQVYLGVFADPAAAALAYDHEARKAFGEFASLNFPDANRCQVTSFPKAPTEPT